MMKTNYLLWSIMWLLAAAFFSAFIVFFGRRKFAMPRMGFFYILFFFIVGVGMLLGSMRLLY